MHNADTVQTAPSSPYGSVRDLGKWERISATARRTVLIAVLFYPIGLAFHINVISPGRMSVAIDFVAFWSAAKVAVQGAAISAFDFPALQAIQFLPPGAEDAYFAWLYPPTFHILITPLGLFGFSPAFAIFTSFGIAMYCLALRPWVRTDPIARNLAIAAPAVLAVVFTGNTSLLWTAAFLGAMHGLWLNKPAQAGIFIALLTMKPQLGILIPVALVAGQHFRVINWAAFFSLLLALVATAIHGVDYWFAFYESIETISARHAVDSQISLVMITWFGFLRQLGVGFDTANLIQFIPAFLALAVVALVWAKRNADANLKIAVLLLATLTATPYAYQYEAMLALVAAVFLARAGMGTSLRGRAWLFLLWVMPAVGQLTPGLAISNYAAPVISASLIACAVIALRRPPGVTVDARSCIP